MAIRLQCVFCSTSIAVHDQLAGREVRCPQCSNKLTVPKKADGIQPKRSKGSQPEFSADAESETETSTSPAAWVSDLSKLNSADEPNWSEPPHRENVTEPEGNDYASTHDESPSPRTRHVSKSEEVDLEWDVTPMVDVAFLLLIFFMITASFSIQKAIPMAPPQEDTPGQTTVVRETQKFREVIILQIDEFNGYTLIGSDGSESVSGSKQELITQLEELQVDQAESVKMLVQAHKLSTHGALVSGLDAARKAGLINFQVQAVDEF